VAPSEFVMGCSSHITHALGQFRANPYSSGVAQRSAGSRASSVSFPGPHVFRLLALDKRLETG
jgi:hypothetical protein